MIGYGQLVQQMPEVLKGGGAVQRLLEAIAARFVEHGCRVKHYRNGIRVYDCKDATQDQSFEVTACSSDDCDTAYSNSVYGQWMAADRQKYLVLLHEKRIIP